MVEAEGKDSRVFNLGTGKGFSVREVIDQSRVVTNKAVPYEEGPRRAGDCTKLVSGSVRAIEELGWEPKRSTMRQMIEDAWRWQQTGHYKPADDIRIRIAAMSLWAAYKLRWKRRRLLWRAFRSRHNLTRITRSVPNHGILAFVTLRNEMRRLPHFLAHYRGLGVAHFLVIDNASSDGTDEYLAIQPDVSLWHTKASYRDARFGLDWQNLLLMRYGHGRWCLTVDADELLVYAHHDRLDLNALTRWLDGQGLTGFGALMLDLFPQGPLGAGDVPADPLGYLRYFNPGPYRNQRQKPLDNLRTRGGIRERMFFANDVRNSPTLNKTPLIKWNRRHAYVNSTHSALPRRLNHIYDGPGGSAPSGVLLHTKFLPEVIEKSHEDKNRRQHFHDPKRFARYYDEILDAPVLWDETALEYQGWQQLADLNLMTPGGFGDA